MASHLEHFEQSVTKKYSRRDTQKKAKMKVSGKSVIRLSRIVAAKAKRDSQ